ncbi:MAG TPA: T9SS type A sorting domain-containing protein [Bacteroidales bacterium]|nr:T9SS type A sorting domain-containing protein [Bacteroidales bacterium]
MKKIILLIVSMLGFTAYINAQPAGLWGMTYSGGNGGGVIFKTDNNGNNLQVVYSFIKNSGSSPSYIRLCEAANGKFYGMTNLGGAFDIGVLFEYDPATNTYTKKIDFSSNYNGRYPKGSLILASNGKLYGMTCQGGANYDGVMFEYDPATDTYTKKFDFLNTSKGCYPFGSLMQASNGKLYGMTYSGGSSGFGVMFEYDLTTNTYTKKHDFTGNSDGKNPYGSLMEASNGKLYGLTYKGGSSDYGIIFEFDPATSAYTIKHDLAVSGLVNGIYPYGEMIQASNGMLYGMTQRGGAGDLGVIFEYNPATNTYTKKTDFTGTLNGSYPYGSLMQAAGGMLYGMTSQGGTNGYGVLFEYDPATGTCTKKIDFLGTSNGRSPLGSLMQVTNGTIYGMTTQGGASNCGVLFEYNPATNTCTKKIELNVFLDGAYPYGPLMSASNGMLYGMACSGGINNAGVLFEYNPVTSTYTKKIDFAGTSNGRYPYGRLVQANNGMLYGMTNQGGSNDWGVLFEYNPVTNILTKKLDFTGTSNGKRPMGSMMKASNGKLYGTTTYGGTNDFGVLFEYDPSTNTFTKKHDFTDIPDGRSPYGSDVMQASNGVLYGTTYLGGSGYGIIFEYDPLNSTYTKKMDFSAAADGRNPYGTLVQTSGGLLYGMTCNGGASNYGVLFEYNPTNNSYIKKLDFVSSNGRNPHGSLLLASNGKLYGGTYQGGTIDAGVLFEYNTTASVYTKKHDFDGITGRYPSYGNLIEIITNYWTGTVSNNWDTPGNWSLGVVPGSTLDAEIPDVAPNPMPVVNSSGAACCRNITIDANASVTINSGKDLTVSGNWTNNGDSLTGIGTVCFTSSYTQKINGLTVFGNLIINNSGGVTLDSPVQVTGVLTPSLGTLSTNGNLTLVSTAAQTALIAGTGYGAVTGDVTMQRYMPDKLGYHYYSSPFSNAPVSGFTDELGTIISAYPYVGYDTTHTVTPFPNFYVYDETYAQPTISIGWDAASATLEPMRGYCINFGGTTGAFTTDISGTVNTGAINYNVTNTPSGNAWADGWNLVGNPYPSPIDWQAPLGWTKTNVYDGIYYFEANTQYSGTYRSFVNGYGTNGATGIIPSMQGFFVKATAGGTLGVTNDVRVNSQPLFFKSTITSDPILRLKGYPAQNSAHADETVVYFDSLASFMFDGNYDAYKMMNNDPAYPNIYTSDSSQSALSINALPPLSNTDVIIPLGFITKTSGNFTIEATELLNFDPLWHIYLEDNQTTVMQDLTVNPLYTFSTVANAPQYRFFIRFSPTVITDIAEQGNSFADTWSSGKNIYIRYSSTNMQHAVISIFNMLGQKIINAQQTVSGTSCYPIEKPGCYIVHVTDGNTIFQKKVILF